MKLVNFSFFGLCIASLVAGQNYLIRASINPRGEFSEIHVGGIDRYHFIGFVNYVHYEGLRYFVAYKSDQDKKYGIKDHEVNLYLGIENDHVILTDVNPGCIFDIHENGLIMYDERFLCLVDEKGLCLYRDDDITSAHYLTMHSSGDKRYIVESVSMDDHESKDIYSVDSNTQMDFVISRLFIDISNLFKEEKNIRSFWGNLCKDNNLILQLSKMPKQLDKLEAAIDKLRSKIESLEIQGLRHGGFIEKMKALIAQLLSRMNETRAYVVVLLRILDLFNSKHEMNLTERISMTLEELSSFEGKVSDSDRFQETILKTALDILNEKIARSTASKKYPDGSFHKQNSQERLKQLEASKEMLQNFLKSLNTKFTDIDMSGRRSRPPIDFIGIILILLIVIVFYTVEYRMFL